MTEDEKRKIKDFCKRHNQSIKYKGRMYYLYLNNIYDDEMNLVIDNVSQGFLELYEYFEYFPPNER